MNPTLRNVLAVIAGLVVGGIVNMGLIMIGGSVIPPPAGVDSTDVESIKASMHLFEAKHFIVPFLAHGLGTLVGAYVAVRIATSHHMKLALGVGAFFLLGGIMMAIALPAPGWFIGLDLIVAYIPAAWLGWKLAGGSSLEAA